MTALELDTSTTTAAIEPLTHHYSFHLLQQLTFAIPIPFQQSFILLV